MLVNSVKHYLTSTVKTPFFLFIGDAQYADIQNELSMLGLDFVPMSRFCRQEDKMPDIDELLTYIQTADVNAKSKKFVITGIGEFLALRGNHEALRILSRLKDFNVGGAKVVLLLRGVASLIAGFQADPRFDARRHYVLNNADCALSLTVAAPSVNLSAIAGFKALLEELEKGRSKNIIVNTAVNLDNAMFTVHKINSVYEAIKYTVKKFTLPVSCGKDEHWAGLLKELNKNSGSLDKIFEKHRFSTNPTSDFYHCIAKGDYNSWLYFIFLKSKSDVLNNSYLRFALEKTNQYETFVSNILHAIMDVPHTDKRFPLFYSERKTLIEKFPESDIANFVINSRQVPSESIYMLTDITRAEREEIIAWLSKHGLISQLDSIYPMLVDYLKTYVFKCPDLADLLTNYFESYKRQKLSNTLEHEFLEKVDQLALAREFNRLPSRNEIIEKIKNDGTFLYWLDALGVEYLGLIEALAHKHNLEMRIYIARAELPTISSINRDFFDAWKGRKEKCDALDETKHKDAGGYNFSTNKLPIHLARELDIIASTIAKAATELTSGHCKHFLIVSDHGASRLAVLRCKEEKYDTDTSGEHSGRCCKFFEPYELPFAAEENGYLVLADYGRFKGSRAANVEVHGGASLEEVVIPVIELSLKKETITVKLVNKTVTVDFRSGTTITLFINASLKGVSVAINGKYYPATQTDENLYDVHLNDIKKAGDYSANVYEGDNLIGQISINAQGKSGKVNDSFEELF